MRVTNNSVPYGARTFQPRSATLLFRFDFNWEGSKLGSSKQPGGKFAVYKLQIWRPRPTLALYTSCLLLQVLSIHQQRFVGACSLCKFQVVQRVPLSTKLYQSFGEICFCSWREPSQAWFAQRDDSLHEVVSATPPVVSRLSLVLCFPFPLQAASEVFQYV